ncbi:MAG: DUF3553 domain-containing protein [Rhodospirillaceae bacterium]|nr:DUF3553 domain-containing protein [Rhodospirillaceae bacterium]
MLETLVPGALVRNPAHPEWGLGQVQSVIANRVTANFENCGKLVIDRSVVALDVVEDAEGP